MPPIKQLIIVCDDSTQQYGNFLLQLIGSGRRGDERVKGWADAIDATIWSEKEYESSRATLSISAYILFVGNGKAAKKARINMPMTFEQVGMHCGWLGTQGCMFVDDLSLNRDNYPEFKRLCEQYGDDFDETIPRLEEAAQLVGSIEVPAEEVVIESVADGEAEITTDPGGDEDPSEHEEATNDRHGIALVPKTLLARAATAISNKADRVGVRVGAFLSNKEARDKQYTLLSLYVYKEALPRFLGMV